MRARVSSANASFPAFCHELEKWKSHYIRGKIFLEQLIVIQLVKRFTA
jgi:hypothetical protein